MVRHARIAQLAPGVRVPLVAPVGSPDADCVVADVDLDRLQD